MFLSRKFKYGFFLIYILTLGRNVGRVIIIAGARADGRGQLCPLYLSSANDLKYSQLCVNNERKLMILLLK